MAEAVGLTLGTVALASLFSVCVELVDYFELGKSYEYDYDLACLKLYLLKARLDTCGKTLSIDDAIHKSQDFRQHWPQEQDVIVRSLLGIKDILGNAALLTDKYRLVAHKSNNPFSIFPAVRAKLSTVAGHSPSSSSRLPNSRGRLSLFRRSTTWVIRDRQKFDALLSDLEFFISNLELIVPRLVMAEQPEEKDRRSLDSYVHSEGCDNTSKEEKEGSIAHPRDGGRSLSKGGRSLSKGGRSLSKSIRSLSKGRRSLSKDGRSLSKDGRSLSKDRRSLSKGGRSLSIGGRSFKITKTSDQTINIQGIQGKAEVTPIAPGQHESYTIEDTKDQSCNMQGYNSDQIIKDALKDRQVMIQGMKSAKSNGSQNARQANNFGGAGRRLDEKLIGHAEIISQHS